MTKDDLIAETVLSAAEGMAADVLNSGDWENFLTQVVGWSQTEISKFKQELDSLPDEEPTNES